MTMSEKPTALGFGFAAVPAGDPMRFWLEKVSSLGARHVAADVAADSVTGGLEPLL